MKSANVFYLFLLIALIFISETQAQASDQHESDFVHAQRLSALEKEITGGKPFVLDTPRVDRTSNIIKVEKFGLSPSNTPDENLVALDKLSAALRGAKNCIVQFPKDKVYTVAVRKDMKLLFLVGCEDVVIDGQGSRLKFQDADTPVRGFGFVYLNQCNRLAVRDLAIGCDWDYKPLALVGKIVEYNPATREALYHIISNGKLNAANQKLWAAQEWDPEAKTRTVNGVGSNFSEYRILLPNVLQVKYTNKFNGNIVGKYSLISIKQNTQYSGVVLENNDHILIERVRFLGIPFMAVEGRDRGTTHHLVIRNCELTPPEPDTYFSAGEGFDVRSPWYLFENNKISHCYDDVMNFDAGIIGAFLAGGLIREGGNMASNEIIADHLQMYFTKNVIKEGVKFGLADENFKPTGWMSTLDKFTYQQNYHKGHSAPHRCVMRFKDDLPKDVPDNYILYMQAVDDGGYVIRNNTISNCIRHAIWAGNGNGTIENNTIYQSGYPAIMLQMTSRWGRWFKGFYPKNVIIRGNKIINCNTTLRQPASLFVGGGYDTQSDGFFPVNYGVCSKILIEDNEIIGSYQAALGGWACRDVIIRGNKITNPFTHQLVFGNHGNGALFMKNAENVFFLNNELDYQQKHGFPTPFVNQNNKNLILENNKGFK